MWLTSLDAASLFSFFQENLKGCFQTRRNVACRIYQVGLWINNLWEAAHTQKKQSQVGIIWGRVEHKLPTWKRCDSPYLCQFLEMLGPAILSWVNKKSRCPNSLCNKPPKPTNRWMIYLQIFDRYKKHNTCIRYIIDDRYTLRDYIVIQGVSAVQKGHSRSSQGPVLVEARQRRWLRWPWGYPIDGWMTGGHDPLEPPHMLSDFISCHGMIFGRQALAVLIYCIWMVKVFTSTLLVLTEILAAVGSWLITISASQQKSHSKLTYVSYGQPPKIYGLVLVNTTQLCTGTVVTRNN